MIPDKPILTPTLILLAAVLGSNSRGEASSSSWWNPKWKCRKVVRVVSTQFQDAAAIESSEGGEHPNEEEVPSALPKSSPEKSGSALPSDDPDSAAGGILDTARIRFYGEKKIRPDGGDIRVVLPTGNSVPCRVKPPDPNGYALVEFKVLPQVTDYFFYFNNPEAGPEAPLTEWTPRPFAIERVTAQSWIGYPSTPEQALKAHQMATSMTPPEGIDQINSLTWRSRYPLVPKAYYVSLYQGFLLAEQRGPCELAIAASGSFYLWIDGHLVISTKNVVGNVRHWRSRGQISFKKGIHSLRLAHVHSGREPGLRLGWRTPDLHEFVPIPPSAFVGHIAADEIAYESLEQPVPVFFSYPQPGSAIELEDRRVVALVKLLDASPVSQEGKPLLHEWQLPGGDVFHSPHASLLVIQGQSVSATLRVTHGGQVVGEYTRPVALGDLPKERLNLTVDLARCPSIVYSSERTNLALSIQNEMNSAVVLKLLWKVTAGQKVVKDHQSLVEVSGHDHSSLLLPLNMTEFPEGKGQIDLSLLLLDYKIFEKRLRLQLWGDDLTGAQVQEGDLRDASGQPLILMTKLEDPNEYKRWAPLKWLYRRADRSTKRVLLIGDPMNSFPSDQETQKGTYSSILESLFSRHEEGFVFHKSQASVKPILDDLIALPDLLQKHRPELVLIAPGLLDVNSSTPLLDFARVLDVMIDRVRGQPHPAQVALVSPPPLWSNPERSRQYRDKMKEISDSHHCTFVDVHDYFLRTPDALKLYFSLPADTSVCSLYPNEEGQRKIAEWILDKID